MSKKVLLMILDGWGHGPNPDVSAIEQANTPFIDSLYKNYPSATLRTDGLHVGLPEGQMGNSEVGHMNLGAGRIVYQDLAKINLATKNGSLGNNAALKKGFEVAKKNGVNLHFVGLLSDGGVHSHIDHLFGLIDAAEQAQIPHYFVHAFTDGRDVDPKSGIGFVDALINKLKKTSGHLASVIGRYYAMDRDQRWERVKLAYDSLVHGQGNLVSDMPSAIQKSYDEGITDEFIKPILAEKNGIPLTTIKDGDVVVFFNFRTDRGRQLTQVLSQRDMHEMNMHALKLHYITMTNYDEGFTNIDVMFDKDNLSETLGEVLEKNHKTQIRIAETEKYPHVTFFFSGGREKPFDGETRILRNSPKVATYDLQPEMSAFDLRDALVPELLAGSADFVCLNFANGDMVGHTGDMQAAIKACETVDACVKDVVTAALTSNYATLLIADHGNCDVMINPDGTPNTAHTTNPVPVILIDQTWKSIKDGVLGDIAPTILKIMDLPQPEQMTQQPLV
ncbi:MAG: 2,3-bisphosphoglycerate-independent phosphoglycerate mutase [Flavobacteriaceae bacterium]|jgi:2,3-bisphosphoglycerate-independent phosphoglycerate mutase